MVLMGLGLLAALALRSVLLDVGMLWILRTALLRALPAPPPSPVAAPPVSDPPHILIPQPPAQKPSPAATPATDLASVVVDPALVTAVKGFEGFSAKATWDYKQWTNGYGTVAASSDEVVTEAVAEQRLMVELGKAAAAVHAFAPNAPIGVQQALADLSFNAGPGWMKAGLGAAVKAGDWAAAKEHLLQYNHAGGQVLAGLTKRREAEASWFDKPL